jgi:branched-chain amino acid aminotransferase
MLSGIKTPNDKQKYKMDIKIARTEKSRLNDIDYDHLGFGRIFSDHMFSMEYAGGRWHNPRITPYGEICVQPSLSVLHYGQAVFEGIKAFYSKDGSVNVFRADRHHDRFNKSCERLCIPKISWEDFWDALYTLVHLDHDWVPKKRGCSLYIRPFTYAADPFIGVKVSDTYRFMLITSPVGAYYGGGPVKLLTAPEYVRAFRGGLGCAKTPANYAASLLPAEVARKKGFSQILWLDGLEGRYLEEVGTMNIFAVIDGKLITPSLEGTILDGVTRDSAIKVARELGIPVEERRLSIDELVSASKEGLLEEVFGTGTAAVITPVEEISHMGATLQVKGKKEGRLSQLLYDEITGIQYGEKQDRFGWVRKI